MVRDWCEQCAGWEGWEEYKEWGGEECEEHNGIMGGVEARQGQFTFKKDSSHCQNEAAKP